MFRKEDTILLEEFKEIVNANSIEYEVAGDSLSGDEWTQIIIAASAILSTNAVRFLVQYIKSRRVKVKDNSGKTIEAGNVKDAIRIIEELDKKEKIDEKG